MAVVVLPDGRTLGYEEWGTPDGAPLIYLHGTPGCRLNRPADPTLWARMGLRVITMDRPGYGMSSDRFDRSVHDVAADVAVLVTRSASVGFVCTAVRAADRTRWPARPRCANASPAPRW